MDYVIVVGAEVGKYWQWFVDVLMSNHITCVAPKGAFVLGFSTLQ